MMADFFSKDVLLSGKELKYRVKELLEAAKDGGFPRAWSKENPLICLAPKGHLSDKAAPTVGLS